MSLHYRVLSVLGVLLSASAALAQNTQSFVTSFTPSTPLRNNYTGFVGMEFNTSGALTVTSLGRIYVAGNTGTHTLKLVNVNFGVVVATVQLTMSAGTPNTFQYVSLPTPVGLDPNASYEILSQETSGGDRWYDFGPVTTTSVAADLASVYTDVYGNPVVVPNTAGTSYIPLSFQYQVSSSGYPPPDVDPVQVYDLTYQGPSYLYDHVTPASGLSVTAVQFQLNGQNYGPVLSGNSVQVNGNLSGWLPTDYSVTATATDSAGGMATSVPRDYASTGHGQTFLTGQSLGSLRNNYGNAFGHFVGMEFTTGVTPLNLFALGRYSAPGNSQSHLLKLVNSSTGADVPGASLTVSMNGVTPGQYVYAYFPFPITLPAATSYYLVSQETAGGDQWYDYAPVSPGTLGSINGPIYQDDGGTYNLVKSPGSSYGPVNMVVQPIPPPYTLTVDLASQQGITYSGIQSVYAAVSSDTLAAITNVQFLLDGKPFGPPAVYQPPNVYNYVGILDSTQLTNGTYQLAVTATDSLGDTATTPSQTIAVSNATTTSNPAFITSFTPTFLRNNYSGFVGMKFTTGASALTIGSLGRLCIAGNTGTHTVKLVQSSTSTDIANASVSVSMTGCTAGQFIYSALSSPITLPAGNSYFLASLEVSGGDQWYDFAPVNSTTIATVNGPVYFTGASWVTVPSPASSYVPLNFLTTTAQPTGTVTVTESVNTATSVVTATADSTAGTIVSVQFYIGGFPIYSPVTSPPFTLTVPSTAGGTGIVTAVATDSAGNTGTSSPLSYGGPTCSVCSPPPPAYLASVINFSGTTLRNNYTGYVGMQITTAPSGLLGSNSITEYAAVGVTCVAGNNRAHLFKLVLASTGVDVPGSTVFVMPQTGCPPTFAQYIPFPVPLATNTSYYLVFQETSGGDQWYDISPAVPTIAGGGFDTTTIGPLFTIDGPVYYDGSKYVLVPLPNYSYVGLQLEGYVTTY